MTTRLTWISLPLSATALVVACGEDTGKKPTGGGGNPDASTLTLPYTPEGCDYTVAPPEAIEDITMHRDVFGATPAPKHIHASWAGAPESTFAINWATDLETKSTQLLYGTDKDAVAAADGPGGEVNLQLGHTMQFGSPVFTEEKTRVHEVHVCGLNADTMYYYKVGGPGQWSEVYDIATAPAPGSKASFKFGVSGDSRSGPENFAKIQERLSTEGIDFQVFSGDFIDLSTYQKNWEDFFEATTGTFKTQDMIARRPLMPVNGNHDNLAVYYVGYFALPQQISPGEGAQGEEWYSFSYANARFFMLNTESGTASVNAQVKYLQEELPKIDRTVTPWVFAVFHSPPYTCGSKHQGDSVRPRENFQPLFDQYKVDVVLTGHVHNYQRSLPIRGFQTGTTQGLVATSGTNGIPVSESGTIYVVSAGAGGDLYNADPASACDFSYITEKVNNYVVIGIEDRTLTYKALRLDGSEIESFTYTK